MRAAAILNCPICHDPLPARPLDDKRGPTAFSFKFSTLANSAWLSVGKLSLPSPAPPNNWMSRNGTERTCRL